MHLVVRHRNRGFTLIELMIVILIIGLLAAIALSALANASETARAQRTRAIINKLDQLIMERWDSYRTRAVPYSRVATDTPLAAAKKRLFALRELQRLEMPENAHDVWDDPVFLAGGAVPAVNRGYRRKCLPLASWNGANEESECLYLMISAMRDGDKSAIDYFAPSEIGDTDSDGQLEILDGWGTPIVFLRWPSGYCNNASNPALTQQIADGSKAPDPFDPLKVDTRWTNTDVTLQPYAIRPLIWSMGPDKANGISISSTSFQYSATTIANDPYDATSPRIGTIATPGDAADNITNHFRGEQ